MLRLFSKRIDDPERRIGGGGYRVTPRDRRYEFDWLRVVAMLAVFLFHCTRFFDTEAWHLKNPQQSEVVFVAMRGLIWPWVMELFFLVSGVGTWYSLRSGGAGRYMWRRIKRLLVPLYTVGFFILLPPQFYFELLTNAGYKGTFWQSVPLYFAEIHLPSITQWPGTLMPSSFSGHLWFLEYLFLVSLVTLPLLLFLKSEHGHRWIERLAGFSEKRAGIFIFVVPLVLVLVGLRGVFEAQRSWADFLWYAIYFVIGFIMASDGRFTSAVKRHCWVCLVLWLVCFSAGIGTLVLILGYDPAPGHEPFSWMYVLFQVLWSVTSWSAVVFMLSIGARYMTSNSRTLAYANEAVLPFYLFHQTIILVVGFYVIPWNILSIWKFLIITAISFPLILLLYELAVRRLDAVRFLFGMRPKPRR